jgi:Zn-dependent M28 family amino/carboxypeptidase
MGIKGGVPGGKFLQPVSLIGVKSSPKTELAVSGNGNKKRFTFGDEFVVFTGAQKPEVSVDAEMVFVGYGIDAPEEKWNDYKGPAEDYRGKILVYLVNDPPATPEEPNLFGGKALTYKGRWTYKFEEAARRGAVGALLLHTNESAGYPWSVVRTSNGSWRFDIARGADDKTPYLGMRAWMTDAAAHKLFAMAGKDLDELRAKAAKRDFQPVRLGLNGTLKLTSELQTADAPNVVGVLEGRDPKLKSEYVVLSAHWDHLGIGEPDKKGDRIYNGAVDNASGVAAVLEIAEGLTRLPTKDRPKRSILFLFPTAEEQGLLGAEWYVQHPCVPLDKTAADINLDSMNVLGRTRDMIALGAERSGIGSFAKAIAKREHVTLTPEPRPEQGSFFRSDHFPFAKRGVPAVDIGHGDDFVGRPAGWGKEQFDIFNQQHYHQPSDEYQPSWDLSGMVQECSFTLALARSIADAPAMPSRMK